MARVELPQSRLRARKRQKRRVYAIIGAASVLAFFGIVVGLSYLPFLQVRAVSVSGTATLATSSVEAYVQSQIAGRYLFVFPKRNIFLYPKHAIAAGLLAEFPELRTAVVHAENFHTLAAAVVEREPKALWCINTDCYLMDQGGVVYAPARGAEGFVEYHGAASGEGLPRQYLTPDTFEALFSLVDALSQKSGAIQTVSVDAQGDAEADFASGFALKFSTRDAGGDVFERYSLALTSAPFAGRDLSSFEYLDLRFGDKLYYKSR